VDEVVGIMRDNIEKVLERDQKLTDLEDKSGELLRGVCLCCTQNCFVHNSSSLFPDHSQAIRSFTPRILLLWCAATA
jgi:hypothetical protein